MLENKQTIIADIHMLATNKPSKLMIDSSNRLLFCELFGFDFFDENNNHQHTNKQFLYATTDEITKQESCWHYNHIFNTISNCESTGYKKIVATTNPELWYADRIWNGVAISEYLNIPKIDTTFLQPYVDAYNAGKPIKQVRLEVEETQTTKREDYKYENGKSNLNYTNRLKLKSNGSVIIHPIVEQKFSYEQLVDAILCNTSMTVDEAKAFVNRKYPQT